MSDKSDIEWTDATWNPVRGCIKISPGCKNCYAETFAERFRGVLGHPYEQGFDLRLVPEKLSEPAKWRAPRRIFVNSMSDLFQDGVPDDYIIQVCAVMHLYSQHTYQVLTKRHVRLNQFLARHPIFGYLPNVWWGVSAEDRKYGLPRVESLQLTPARNRFVSFEPLLEGLGNVDLGGIGWVIIGGESGHGARGCDVLWMREILRQAKALNIPTFVKQLGAKPFIGTQPYGGHGSGMTLGAVGLHLKSAKGGDPSEWPSDLVIREFPST